MVCVHGSGRELLPPFRNVVYGYFLLQNYSYMKKNLKVDKSTSMFSIKKRDLSQEGSCSSGGGGGGGDSLFCILAFIMQN